MMIGILASFALMVVIASPSLAQAPVADSLPAVSQVNGKVSLEGGATGARGASSAIGIAQGSLTLIRRHREDDPVPFTGAFLNSGNGQPVACSATIRAETLLNAVPTEREAGHGRL